MKAGDLPIISKECYRQTIFKILREQLIFDDILQTLWDSWIWCKSHKKW